MIRKNLLVIFLLTSSAFTTAAQENVKWIECFQERQQISYLRTKQEVAKRWGIDYTALQFYADSLQWHRTDSMARIHDRYFKAYSKHLNSFARVHDSLSKRHGQKWRVRFNREVDSSWRKKFTSGAEDSICYPFYSISNGLGRKTYSSDTVKRGCINLKTLEFEKDKIVPPNNYVSLFQYNQLYFPKSEFVKILSPKKRKQSDGYCHHFFMHTINGKEYKISLFDSSNTYYNEIYNGGLRVTSFTYHNMVVLVTQPKHFLGKEIIILDQKTRKVIKRLWVAPINLRKGIGIWDEVCGYEETTTISCYNNKLIINIDVHCDENAQQDALHIIDLKNMEVKLFSHR